MDISFASYLSGAPKKDEIHYWDLPDTVSVGINLRNSMTKRKSITVKKLMEIYGKDPHVENLINHVGRSPTWIKIKFPINLKNRHYARLYSLMFCEGSTNTEFGLHVPEKEFHRLFSSSIKSLLGQSIEIKCKKQRGIPRSRAPTTVRYLIPIYDYIPYVILSDKEFSREYLRIAFEAEGSPIFSKSKRYISLKRNIDVSHILNGKVRYRTGMRVYTGKFEKDYTVLAASVKNSIPLSLIGDSLILKHYFGIEPKLSLEAVQINKTAYRCGGKIAARWALVIPARYVGAYTEEIGFLSKRKKDISKKMSLVKGRRKWYFALELMENIADDNQFDASKFNSTMASLGYTTPQKFIWDYQRKGLIRRVSKGRYKLLRRKL